MLEKVLPHAMLKAKSNLESRIRTLKRDWAIIYEHRQMVVNEDAVWNSYITIDQLRHHSFPYYDQLTSIYAKDRAIGKDAQTTTDIVEEIDVEDVATVNNIKEGSNYHKCKNVVSLDKMEVSAT
ncbi:hypothetical protein Goarm_003307 [Gossypium armourianum]|uniref:Uncharacterized protein n=1 Tax=Gossypium armourianum TaxID=34283 RepID=A0A7J9K307_9ROSI|nr:hypothetical protein [Gossypium armourianum]